MIWSMVSLPMGGLAVDRACCRCQKQRSDAQSVNTPPHGPGIRFQQQCSCSCRSSSPTSQSAEVCSSGSQCHAQHASCLTILISRGLRTDCSAAGASLVEVLLKTVASIYGVAFPRLTSRNAAEAAAAATALRGGVMAAHFSGKCSK